MKGGGGTKKYFVSFSEVASYDTNDNGLKVGVFVLMTLPNSARLLRITPTAGPSL